MSHESTCSVLKMLSCLPHSSHNPRIITRPSHFTATVRKAAQHDTLQSCFFNMFQINPLSIYRRGTRPTHIHDPSLPPLSLSLASMASLLHQLSLVFLLFLASSSFQIHARESRFFMKATRPEDPKEATPIPEETPAVKMEDPSTLPPLQSLSGSGYGLYGHRQEQFTPATTTDHNNNNNNNYYYSNARPTTELTRENYENRYNGAYNYANQFKYAYNRPSKFSNEEFNSGSYETKGYNNYVDPNKQYGLSDTRFLENGRYFYDVNAERNRNQYETYPTRGNPEAGARGGKYGNGVYGNGNAYEYRNTVGGYQNNQVNQERQEEYVP